MMFVLLLLLTWQTEITHFVWTEKQSALPLHPEHVEVNRFLYQTFLFAVTIYLNIETLKTKQIAILFLHFEKFQLMHSQI